MIDIVVPAEQEGTKAIVRAWLKQVGDTVAEGEPLVELETDKVTQEVSSPAAGIIEEILLASDAEAIPGAILGRLRGPMSGVTDVQTRLNSDVVAQRKTDTAVQAAVPEAAPALSPAVRRAVREHGIDVSAVAGSGRGGRITREDVDREVGRRDASPTPGSRPLGQEPEPVVTGAPVTPGVRVIPHDRMRRAIAENMLHSVRSAPHVTSVFEADFSAVMAHRRRHKAAFEKRGINLTITAYLVSASVDAMRAAPSINSRWYDDRLEIFDDINIGVGTALGDEGLIVPVVQRAQDLPLEGLAARLGELTNRARANKLSPADVRQGTFTISNHGTSGSLFATPIIINRPQSAILGVGKLVKRVVVREVDGIDTIQIRPMCYVSLTIDHRVVDGHQTNAWLSRFVETIEGWPS